MAIGFLNDMDNVFLNSGFEEDITYNGVSISAIVYRVDSQKVAAGRTYPISKTANMIQVSKTDVSSVNDNEDTVIITQNGSSRRYRVSGIKNEDPGSFTLGLV